MGRILIHCTWLALATCGWSQDAEVGGSARITEVPAAWNKVTFIANPDQAARPSGKSAQPVRSAKNGGKRHRLYR